MQFLKGDIQEGILKAAEEVFLEKGYKDASMREIASRAGVTVSNIYHYFTNKDEIFRTILKPVLNDLYAMIYNHDADQMTIDVFMDSDYQKMSVREYIRLVSEHRDRLRLLLFQAQGSVLENFRSEYTDSPEYGMVVCPTRRAGVASCEERRDGEVYSGVYRF